MPRRAHIGGVPRDQLPEMADPRWDKWSDGVRMLIERTPVGWDDLRLYAEVARTSTMAVRNIIGWLEERGYAVSFYARKRVVWCGCTVPCAVPKRGCPKAHRAL